MKLIYFVTVFIITISSAASGKEYKTKLLSIEECGPISSNLNISGDWSVADVEGEIVVSLNAEIGEVFDLKEFKYSAKVSTKENDEYKELMILDGSLCVYCKGILGAEWNRFRSSIEPKVENGCKIEPGTYKLDDYTPNVENTNLVGFLPEGYIKIEMEVIKEENTVGCAMFELSTE